MIFYRKDINIQKTVEKIILAIKEKPKISNKELEIITGLSRRGVEWNIKKTKKIRYSKKNRPR
ncbi:MAG: winged helix-turn-helix transcriptional regulator [Candidatus Nanoarchaeia archaeon]|nr:winged helix-turn-helix transcriptional regulator [Candidatus Nanoarchaeia archaeon]